MTTAEELRARLLDPALSGLLALDSVDVDDIRVAASQLGFASYDIDLHGADRDGMFDRFAVACGFPAWFGKNWDALLDSLSDWSWQEEMPGYVLFVVGIEAAEMSAEDVKVFSEILDEASRRMAQDGTPMWICVVGHAGVV
ncbi:MAG: barstar family protein [Kofleriaceae bacterium]|nr:barstar family protein [Kofleriaceae bacterium]